MPGHRNPAHHRTASVAAALARRRARGVTYAPSTLAAATPGHLEQFFAEWERRAREDASRGLQRYQRRIAELRRADERATKWEAQTSFEIEVRGACGSDAHPGGGGE